MRSTIFELLKKELIGKYTFTKRNAKFKIQEIYKGYDNIQNNFHTNGDTVLNGIKLTGIDDNGMIQELVVVASDLVDLFYFKP